MNIGQIGVPRPPIAQIGYVENPREFKERIRKARIDAGLTQKELAKRLGVDVCTVRNWEAGRARPGERRLQAIVRLLPIEAVLP